MVRVLLRKGGNMEVLVLILGFIGIFADQIPPTPMQLSVYSYTTIRVSRLHYWVAGF